MMPDVWQQVAQCLMYCNKKCNPEAAGMQDMAL